jgi:hypothetical protein
LDARSPALTIIAGTASELRSVDAESAAVFHYRRQLCPIATKSTNT